MHRHERPLRVLLNALFHVRSAAVLRADFTLYRVLASKHDLAVVGMARLPDRGALLRLHVEGWAAYSEFFAVLAEADRCFPKPAD